MIRTLHGRGYRFVAPAQEPTPPPRRHRRAGPVRRAVRYTTSDGLNIAYQVTGGGDLDIVLISGFVSHLDHDWVDPRHAHFLDRLGSMGRLIRFDKRGTGMSDRPSGLPDLETRMHDVLAVMDAAGSDRAMLVGYSEGGPMAMLFAATHPERVSRSCCTAATPADRHRRTTRGPRRRRNAQVYADQLVTGWDWEADMRFAARRPTRRWTAGGRPAPGRRPPLDGARADGHERPGRRARGAAGGTGADAGAAPSADAVVLVEDGRYLAEHIPNAQLVELDGADHFVSGNPDQILDPVERFLRASPTGRGNARARRHRGGSGRRPEEALRSWLRPAAGCAHLRGGREVALFDGPATAVRAGRQLSRRRSTSPRPALSPRSPRDVERIGGFGVASRLSLAEVAPPGSMWTRPRCGTCWPGPESTSTRSGCTTWRRRAAAGLRAAVCDAQTAGRRRQPPVTGRACSRCLRRWRRRPAPACRWSGRRTPLSAARLLDQLPQLLRRRVALT